MQKFNRPTFGTQYQEETDTDVLDQEINKLIMLNDDYNTFNHVINVLCAVCGHNPQQAEQCAWIVHTKGKCVVKEGLYEDLKPMLDGIHNNGIGAEIQ